MSNIKIGDKVRYIGRESQCYDNKELYEIKYINHNKECVGFTDGSSSHTAYDELVYCTIYDDPWWKKVEVTQVDSYPVEIQKYIYPAEFITMLTADVNEFASYFKITNAQGTVEDWRKGFADFIIRKCDAK